MSVLTITKTDALEVETMKLAVTDLSQPFIYRLTAPFIGPWIFDKVSVISLMMDKKTVEDVVKERVLATWQENAKMVAETGSVVPEIEWLLNLKDVRIFPVTTVRVPDAQVD